MKFFYNNDLSMPTVKEELFEGKPESGAKTCITHCHSSRYDYTMDFFSLKERAALCQEIDSDVRKIKICRAFLEEYKKSANLSDIERAEISAHIEDDENATKLLTGLKPMSCSIS